jgi:putative ABC transport system permease protein
VYTLVGVYLIYIWEIDFSVGVVESIFGPASGDIEMFFLSGVMVTLAATFIVVYNADLILTPLTRLGHWLGAMLPSLKMAIAYPLANRTRTGMTMAMFCLVVFALTVMSSLNYNFNRLLLSDNALGGWDIEVQEHPSNPIGALEAALGAADAPVADRIEAVGSTSLATRFRASACELRSNTGCDPSDTERFEEYTVLGEDEAFISSAEVRLQSRAEGYDSDEAAWDALASQPNLAIVDLNAIVGQGFGTGFIEGIDATKTTFEPVTVRLLDRSTGQTADVTVIGVIDIGGSQIYMGVHIGETVFNSVFGTADSHRFFVRTEPGTANKQAAQDIEAALLEAGVQAESLRETLNDATAVQTGFFRLIQGFMGLGLLVGVAAVGVIAFRTVVERRQQIGMLRAIGYTRKMVGMTFLIESAFIAFMGVLSGVVFALILSRQLITEEFSGQGAIGFAVPWAQLAVIGAFAFGFALLMTLIPSRQAARIPIAEALRYE